MRENYENQVLKQYDLMFLAIIHLHCHCILIMDIRRSDMQIGEREDFISWKNYYEAMKMMKWLDLLG